MPRPKRVQTPNAWYIVSNEGNAKKALFFNTDSKKLFLVLLEEMCVQFQVECHGYCLLKNGYYLILRTPLGNLGLAMRHLNGVFTQHYNRLFSHSGSLFKGRYRSALFSGDESLKKLSRFIHYLPVQKRMTQHAETYSWSSFTAFLNHTICPAWLHYRWTLLCFDDTQKVEAYIKYVTKGTDEPTKHFFNRKKRPAHFGQVKGVSHASSAKSISLEAIVASTAAIFHVETDSILQTKKGRGPVNIPRYVALYLARLAGQHSIKDIATYFNVGHVSSISVGIKRFEEHLRTDAKLKHRVSLLLKTVGKYAPTHSQRH